MSCFGSSCAWCPWEYPSLGTLRVGSSAGLGLGDTQNPVSEHPSLTPSCLPHSLGLQAGTVRCPPSPAVGPDPRSDHSPASPERPRQLSPPPAREGPRGTPEGGEQEWVGWSDLRVWVPVGSPSSLEEEPTPGREQIRILKATWPAEAMGEGSSGQHPALFAFGGQEALPPPPGLLSEATSPSPGFFNGSSQEVVLCSPSPGEPRPPREAVPGDAAWARRPLLAAPGAGVSLARVRGGRLSAAGGPLSARSGRPGSHSEPGAHGSRDAGASGRNLSSQSPGPIEAAPPWLRAGPRARGAPRPGAVMGGGRLCLHWPC